MGALNLGLSRLLDGGGVHAVLPMLAVNAYNKGFAAADDVDFPAFFVVAEVDVVGCGVAV